VWDWIPKSKRSMSIVLAIVLLISFVGIAYAGTNHPQSISDAFNNLLFQTNPWFQTISDSFNNILFQASGHYQQINEYVYYLCFNTTDINTYCGGQYVQFTPLTGNSIQTVHISGSCLVSPSSMSGDGTAQNINLNGICTLTFTLPASSYWVANGLTTLSLTACIGCSTIVETYGTVSITTITYIVYQTTTINPNLNPCTNATTCSSNQGASFINVLIPALIIIGLFLYIPLQMGVRNDRVLVFCFMMGTTVVGFLSAIGGLGSAGIPWYIVIFTDIIGLLVILGMRTS